MTFQVQLPIFEGPMDLLIFFIQRDQIDITDIPISTITEEFIDYIEMMNRLDLAIGGDFLVMASMLMRIKSRLLLPQETDDGEPIEDPRDELVQMLLDYQRVKEVAGKLQESETIQKDYFTNVLLPEMDVEPEAEELLQKITLVDLMSVFRQLLEELPEISHHEIERIEITQQEQRDFLIGLFGHRKKYVFSEVAEYLDSRLKIVVTFLAILDLIKENLIRVSQDEKFGDFLIERMPNLIVGESA